MPIFINNIPVPLAQDAYIVAIIAAFALHHYFPVLREVVQQSSIVKVGEMKCCFKLRVIMCLYNQDLTSIDNLKLSGLFHCNV